MTTITWYVYQTTVWKIGKFSGNFYYLCSVSVNFFWLCAMQWLSFDNLLVFTFSTLGIIVMNK